MYVCDMCDVYGVCVCQCVCDVHTGKVMFRNDQGKKVLFFSAFASVPCPHTLIIEHDTGKNFRDCLSNAGRYTHM